MLAGHENDPAVRTQIADMVIGAADSPERDGLLALIYHEGIGVPADLDKSLECAAHAAAVDDGLGCFMLGYMCDNNETSGKYAPGDAVRFYERCAAIGSRWQGWAIFWLCDYYHDIFADVEHADADLCARLFKWTEAAARHEPKKYAALLGRLYEDGTGCGPDKDKAVDCYEEACSHGDWRGAKSLARLLEQYLAGNPAMSAAERSECESHIRALAELGEQLYEDRLLHDEDERDNSIEED